MQETFECWALVELMGHLKIAGKCTEIKFGNNSMLRIDVPAIDPLPAFSKIVSVTAVYAINPMTEPEATEYAKNLKSTPLDKWDMTRIFQDRIEELIQKGALRKPELAESIEDQEEQELPW